MIQSMTGYGKSVLQLPTKKVTIEIKTLNSKNLDLNVRIPSYYKEKELSVRKKLASALVRGKVDFSIFVEMTADETSTVINNGVVGQYMQQLRNVVQTGSSDDVELLKMAIKMPDALKTEREELDENEWNQIDAHIDEAIKDIVQYAGTYFSNWWAFCATTIWEDLSPAISLAEKIKSGAITPLIDIVISAG